VGGDGSGGHNKAHRMAEREKRIDSFALGRRADMLRRAGVPSVLSVLEWDGGKSCASIRLSLDSLFIAYRSSCGEILQPLPFEWISGENGRGRRAYFHCPRCDRRVRMLYVYPSGIKCRTCARLNYAVQQDRHPVDQIICSMAEMLRERFKVTSRMSAFTMLEFIPPKPPGMRQSTYKRLCARYRALCLSLWKNLSVRHPWLCEDIKPRLP